MIWSAQTREDALIPDRATEQGKLLHSYVGGLHEIFLKDRRVSLASPQCGAGRTVFSRELHGASQEEAAGAK